MDELKDHQLAGLKWTVRHAYEGSSFYRAHLDAAGVSPADIRELPGPKKLPLTTGDDLRDGYPFPFRAVPFEQIVRIHASSGTTGKRKILCYTAKRRGRLAAFLRPVLRNGRGHPPGPGADRGGLRGLDRGRGLPGGL